MNSVNSSVLFHLSYIQKKKKKVEMSNRLARGLINLKWQFKGLVLVQRFPFLDLLMSTFSLDVD